MSDEKNSVGIQISNALMFVTTLFASFIAAGVFTDPNLLKNGVPQGIFNALCLFICALFCAMYTLSLASIPPNKNIKLDVKCQPCKYLLELLHSWRMWLFLSASLLLAGLSCILLQVVCVQFTTNLVPNCQAASWGVIAVLIYSIGGIPILVLISILYNYRKPKTNAVIPSESIQQPSKYPSEEPSSKELQLILQTLLKELDNIVDKKLHERTMNHESA